MPKISKSKMAKLFQRLGTSYSAGIDIRSVIEQETKTGSPAYQLRAKRMHRELSEGKELAEAMAATDGYFPDLAVNVVKAGERGGRLEESFFRLGQHYKNIVTFRNNFLQALAWPAFELVAAIVIAGGLMAICDNMMAVMDLEKIDWFWMGSTVGNVIAYFVLVFVFFSCFAFVVIGTNNGWFGTLPIRLAMRIPLIGKTIQCLALSRLAWTMSVADNAGMDALDTVKLSLRATENFYYKRLETEICDSIREGNGFYPSFAATDAFPQDLLIPLENGETAGQIAESMDRVSHEMQAKAEVNMKAIGTIGFVATLLFVAALVAGILIFSVQQYVNMLNSLAS